MAKRAPAKGKAKRAPRRRAQAAPVRRGPRIRALRGNYLPMSSVSLSPDHAAPYPAQACEGDALPVTGLTRTIINGGVGANQTLLLVVGNTGVSSTSMVSVTIDTTAGTAVLAAFSAAAGLNLNATAGGPTSGRSMKSGFALLNSTSPLNASGLVYTLRSKQRVLLPAAPTAMTAAQWSTTANEIRAHVDTHVLSGPDYIAPKSYFSHPVDTQAFHEYTTWIGTETVTQFLLHCCTWTAATETNRNMNYFFIVIDGTPVQNTYMLTSRQSYYTRWPLNTVPAAAQIPVPTAPIQELNAAQKASEDHGSRPIEDSNLRGTLVPGKRSEIFTGENAIAAARVAKAAAKQLFDLNQARARSVRDRELYNNPVMRLPWG
jgi:hypothetical protein